MHVCAWRRRLAGALALGTRTPHVLAAPFLVRRCPIAVAMDTGGLVGPTPANVGALLPCNPGPLYVATTPGDELGMMGAWQWALKHL